MTRCFFPLFLLPYTLMFLASCGGPASYTTPLVMDSRIVQSEGRMLEEGTTYEERVTVRVRDGLVEVKHENICLPCGTLLGIRDRDGRESWCDPAPYYYLDADTDYITLREAAQLVNNDLFCLYDLTVTVQHISGGEYTFYLFDHRGRVIEEATTEIEMR